MNSRVDVRQLLIHLLSSAEAADMGSFQGNSSLDGQELV